MTNITAHLHDFFIYRNVSALDNIEDFRIRQKLQQYVDTGHAYLDLHIHDLLPHLHGDYDVLEHLPHLNNRILLGQRPYGDMPLLRGYINSLPKLDTFQYSEVVRHLKTYGDIRSLQYLYSLVAERLTREDMDVFVDNLRLGIPPFLDPHRFHGLIDWERFFNHDFEWNARFCEYMEPYWDVMPYDTFNNVLNGGHKTKLPERYVKAIDCFIRNAAILEGLEPFTHQPTLGTILQYYGDVDTTLNESILHL